MEKEVKRKTEITSSLEDYLEAIYELAKTNESVRVTDIAIKLGISKPSVNRAVNTLKDQGLVEHEHYGSLNLTPKGSEIATNVTKRHKMLKQFLCDVLGVANDKAEEEACLLEHHISPDTMEKLAQFLEKLVSDQVVS